MKKRVGKSGNMYVMFGLLAVLFISLGYLSMQSKEGFREGIDKAEDPKKKEEDKKDSDLGKIVKELSKSGFKGSRQGFRGREGLEMECPAGKSRKIPGGPCA